ncbi:hypothetical protein MED121_17369 [Marinomonas sp. MED121]|uniref:DUF3467 domain-containing protein n=1 Tax=Marinomonas sp. MED121 TaxID=314277 RepID=UPI0000690FF6|nr:DUF3467 domain-containing protein [Marinomonas sp. MED121]EAQ67719.1 hypothetical protein MED121_17369 [Marinomonas sp. MED121]
MTDMTNLTSESAPQDKQQKIQVRVNRENMTTTYTNAIQPIPSADEVMLDFGLNHEMPKMGKQEEGSPREFALDINQRIIMNYATAKKLALMLAQVVKGYEKDFGDIQLNPEQRRVNQAEENQH